MIIAINDISKQHCEAALASTILQTKMGHYITEKQIDVLDLQNCSPHLI